MRLIPTIFLLAFSLAVSQQTGNVIQGQSAVANSVLKFGPGVPKSGQRLLILASSMKYDSLGSWKTTTDSCSNEIALVNSTIGAQKAWNLQISFRTSNASHNSLKLKIAGRRRNCGTLCDTVNWVWTGFNISFGNVNMTDSAVVSGIVTDSTTVGYRRSYWFPPLAFEVAKVCVIRGDQTGGDSAISAMGMNQIF